MGETRGSAKRIAVITVHGTGDTADGPDGEKWFQNGSQFVTGLKAQLAGRGLEADVHPYLWSGANSASEREKGARSLTRLIRKLAKNYEGVHVIGHSHGGNVANDAATMLNWSRKQKKSKLASLTTVGTPFFRTQVSRSEALGAWAFGIMAIISTVVLLPALLLSMLALVIDGDSTRDATQQALDPQTRTIFTALLIASVAGLAALVFVFPLAFRGLARIRRAGRRPNQDTPVFSVRHPEDEAISLLRRIEGVRIEPFPRGSLLRGSRTAAIVWGVRAVLTIPLIGIFLMITDLVLIFVEYARGDYERSYVLPPLFGLPLQDMGLVGIGALLVAVGLAAAPIVFGAVYLIYRALAGTAGEFAFRNTLNGVVGGALRGLAFGRDGDNRIGDVSPSSHYYATLSHVLSGDVAERMFSASNDASRRLFEKYRRGVFSTESDQNEVLNEIAKDALTWDSLVHTLYFDQPEVVGLCSAYIGAVASGAEPTRDNALRDAIIQECPPRPRRKLWMPLLQAAGVVGLAFLVVGGAVVLATPLVNRNHLAREATISLSSRTHTAGDELRDCEECPEMVVLGGGIFTMGSPTSEDGHSYDEGPLRRITIAPFAVSRYEVTFDQWRACEAEGGCSRHATLDLSAIAPEFGVLPVVAISWEQAREYTQWLSQKTGQTYRLLSEAEWEYAARGGMTTRYSWGDDDPVCEAGAANGAAYGSYVASEACSEIQPVGSYQANDFGLYDMHGNAAEWVEDCYSATYFGRDAAASPNTWPDCWGHVVRGGSGFDLGSEWSVRSAYRSLNGESTAFIGFRVARDLQ